MISLRDFDTVIARQVARLPESFKRPFEILGNCTTPLIWAIALTVFMIFERPTGLSESMLVLAATPLASISKFAFRRQRPPTIYAGGMRIKSYSFPSSHAYAAALGGSFIAYTAFTHGLILVGLAAIMLAVTIGISRIYLGAHYPSDVLAGWLLGATILIGLVTWI